MESMVYDFSPQGEVSGLHRDSFSLAFLGKQAIKRASEIVFDEQSQLWSVVLPGYDEAAPEAAGFDGYDQARVFEAAWLDLCRLNDMYPMSEEGRLIACTLRLEGAALTT